ncbi:MAG: DUF1571 domain-containing protein [Planctomycetales bacterium]|nr:DUF1571 domain-containing protein [Planctomycetales bacterium]
MTLVFTTGSRLHAEEPDVSATIDSRDQLDEASRADFQLHLSHQQKSHPLAPTLRIADEGYQRIVNEIRDYTCVMTKRERIRGQLQAPETFFAKVRHRQVDDGNGSLPFALYIKFEHPASIRDREVLFVNRDADSKLLVRKGGQRLAFLTLAVDPHSPMVMSGSRYPITEFGIKRLVERMIVLGKKDLEYAECDVNIHSGATFEDHDCTRIEVTHPIKRDYFQYHLVRVYIDNELGLPIRFESYDWPDAGSDRPLLKEEYTYRDVQLNVGLTDEDFHPDNPGYGFR